MKCICNDKRHDTMTALWHNAYCRWYDHDRAGHRVRSAVWGWLNDRIARMADRIGWGRG